MNQKIIELLNKERVSVFSLVLSHGDAHAAAMHFSFTEEPFLFYFQTSNTSLKARGLLQGETTTGALVIGTSEVDWVTLQVRGTLRALTDAAELERVYKVHYAKQPQAEQYKEDPETMFLELAPTWWRYTDFKTSPETIIEG